MSPVPKDRGERDLRTRIIDAATRLFAEHGFSGTTIRQVVAACGCTKPALYYYFDSKETLFREVVALHLGTTSAMIRAAIEGEGPVRERLHQSVVTFVEYARAQPAVMRLLQRIETQPEDGAPDLAIMATRELQLDLISTLIAQGVASGQLRADVSPRDSAMVLAGTLSFQFELALATSVWDIERMHRTMDLIFDGISV